MRVFGNKLRHLRDFYLTELRNIYPATEIDAMFRESVMHYLGYSSTQVISRMEENVNQSDLLKIYDCAKELASGRPLQYILNTAWFCGLRFEVNPTVLIPRPETEELVEFILNQKPQLHSLLDIGTGSGCIPVSIAKNRQGAKVSACDISDEALQTAGRNASLNNVSVNFFKADALNKERFLNECSETFEVVVSNPPYIKKSESFEMADNVLKHEPHLALFVDGEDDILFYRQIIELCKPILNPGGSLFFELNPLTAKEVAQCAGESGIFTDIGIHKDLNGKDRFFSAKKI